MAGYESIAPLAEETRQAHKFISKAIFLSLLIVGAYEVLISAATALACTFDVVVIETVGVGQSETEVADVADTVAVVVQPGSGDVLQFLKSGIMEIPDVLVVTKADLGQIALSTRRDVSAALRTLAGALMKIAVEKGRAANPKLKIGICGEHGGDPTSVRFCDASGLTYVSCSPFRVAIARLAAAQAQLTR